MSKRWQKSNNFTCRQKRAYRDEQTVSLVADSLSLRFYKCACCGFWHLTRRT